jgi:hypothetical protein
VHWCIGLGGSDVMRTGDTGCGGLFGAWEGVAVVGDDAALLAGQVVPYMTAAAAVYGGAVLARVRDDAADATVGLGRRLLQRIFGARGEHQELPEPVADLVVDPGDSDVLAALRLAVRKALVADSALAADVQALLSGAGGTITASGERSVAAQEISGIAVTGDNVTIHQRSECS